MIAHGDISMQFGKLCIYYNIFYNKKHNFFCNLNIKIASYFVNKQMINLQVL